MENQLTTPNRKVNTIFLLLLLGLLLLRFPYLISVGYKDQISKIMGSYVYDGCTYLITALLIILKRDSLSDYNISLFSLIVFITAPVAGFLSEYLGMHTVQPDLWFRIGISICLLIALLIYRPKLPKRSVKKTVFWLLIAVVVGICGGIVFGKISGFQSTARFPYRPSALIIISSFFIQLGNAAAMEEPLFRGFLWGFLRKLHWKDTWIWLFQAALFWLGHIYYLGVSNYSFWIIIPLSALILGLVAWRSRSIGTSMIVHGLINSITDIVGHFTW